MSRLHLHVGLYLLVLLPAGAKVALSQYYYVDPRNKYQNTPLEGALHGSAEIGKAQALGVASQAATWKAIGQAIASKVEAIAALENARGRAIENSVKSVSVYYEKKKLYETFQALSAPERASQDDLIRFARQSLPEKPEQSVSGAIAWPEVLLAETFAESRSQLDYVFAQRHLEPLAEQGELIKQARTAAEQLREQLRKVVDDFSPGEYLAARRFVDALEAEAQSAPRPGRVAEK